MGMNALTIIQLIGIILGYSALVLGLPALALRRPLLRLGHLGQPGHLGEADRLESLGAADWLLFSFAAGNGYIILLTFLLQLCRICNRVTLFIGILLPIAVILWREPAFSVKGKGGYVLEQFRRLVRGTYGPRSFWRWFFLSIGKWIKTHVFDPVGRLARRKREETALFIILTAAVVLIFGHRALTVYGYSSNDTLLLNYRLNAMDRGAFFSDGFYPFGFSCLLFALHKLFGIRIFTLMRLFYFVTALFLVYTVYALVRRLVRNIYAAFAAALLPVILPCIFPGSFVSALYCTLPGTHAVIFLLLAADFAVCLLHKASSRIPLYSLVLSLVLALVIGPSSAAAGQVMGSNEAVVCLTRILQKEEKDSWSLVGDSAAIAATGAEAGVYDISEFLQDAADDASVYIPTADVYFFIDKDSESAAGAEAEAYIEAFRQLFPESCTIWYENGDFTCYRVRQNPERLYDFAIDYGDK